MEVQEIFEKCLTALQQGKIQGYTLSEDRKKLEFISNINEDNGYTNTSVGTKTSEMEFYGYSIEWTVNDGEYCEGIGLEIDEDTNLLTGYDGVFEIPVQAMLLAAANGIMPDHETLFMDSEIEAFYNEITIF